MQAPSVQTAVTELSSPINFDISLFTGVRYLILCGAITAQFREYLVDFRGIVKTMLIDMGRRFDNSFNQEVALANANQLFARSNGGSSESRANGVTARNALNNNSHGSGLAGTANANIQTIEEMYTQYHFTMEDEGPPAPPSSVEENIIFDSQFAFRVLTLGVGAGNTEGPNGLHNRGSPMQQDLARSGAQDGAILTRPGGEAPNGVHTYPVHSQQAAGSPPESPLLPAMPVYANGFAVRDQTVPSVLPSDISDRTLEGFETTSLPEVTPETETGNSWESVDTSRLTRTATFSGRALSDIMEDATEDEFGEGRTDLSLNSSFTAQPLLTERNGQGVLQSISTVDTNLVIDRNAEGSEAYGTTNLADQDQEWETTEGEEEASGPHDQIVLNVQIPEVVLPSLPSDPPTLSFSRNVVSAWDPLSTRDNLSPPPPGALLVDKLKPGSFLETQCTKDKAAKFGIQFTDSLTDQEVPTSQEWLESRIHATALSTQRVTTPDKIAASTSASLLRNRVQVKDPAARRCLKMPHCSAESTDCSYTTSTEPFPDLNLASSEAASVERARLVDAAARIYAPEPRRRREFPNARLTVDRRHRVLTDPQLVAAQDIVGKHLLIIGTILYPLGGFLLINSIAEDGIYAHNAMMEVLKPYLAELKASMDRQARGEAAAEDVVLKPLNIIVITDGVPSDDVESVIVSAAKKLDSYNAEPWQVGIQFFQVGNEAEAAADLRELDDALSAQHGIRDMVDTVPWSGGTGEQTLSAEECLKVTMGAVNRRLDRRRLPDEGLRY
ncbi:hypothetical protein DV737_g4983, partial [Chaetothyriales sp. CBS 132003]